MRRAAPQRAVDRLIVALDVTSLATALAMARKLRGVAKTVKIGSVLFTACGPSVIRQIRALGFRVMLDLKFFDIPNTVELSCRAAVRHRVSLLTVHAAGGREMLEAAVRGAKAGRFKSKVFAVTRLTSVPHPATIRVGGIREGGGSQETMNEVRELAYAASDSGCDGVVASAEEAPELRKMFGGRLQLICPGIRPAGTFRDDQRRVATPAQALADGADMLVVGRPITASRDPRAAAQHILSEMEEHGC